MTDPDKIDALTPNGPGHQFVFYGDSCSGVPGAPHEARHAAINRVVARLDPPPEFVVFPGDEVIGLTDDMAALRAQWRYWLDHEMAWLDRDRSPVFHSTGNHTTYSPASEAVFAEMLDHLPDNGPPDQRRLSYWVRHGDVALIFVHTLCQRLGGEGHVDLDWLAQALDQTRDARWRFVVGHHPAFAVNGYHGDYGRTLGAEYVPRFWDLLRAHDVVAYLCSHILAFDVQAHAGVLQITSAGAGTAHRMPEGIEYLHAVQMALDAEGLRLQVLDESGTRREGLHWPIPVLEAWRPLSAGRQTSVRPERALGLRFRGRSLSPDGSRQTLLEARADGAQHAPLWIGLSGTERRLLVLMRAEAGRSPQFWLGPNLGVEFDVELALHFDMGPGGVMIRQDGHWQSLDSSSAWGLERLDWPDIWHVGQGADGQAAFIGDLQVHAGLPTQSGT